MITNPAPLYVTYNAGTHCPACAEARFGMSLYDREPPRDESGNFARPIYGFEHDGQDVSCETCGHPICY